MQWVANLLPINVGSCPKKVNAKFTPEASVFSSAPKAIIGQSCPFLQMLAKTFLLLADAKLTSTQKLVLQWSAKILKFHELTLTGLADELSRRIKIPYSTVKWNLRTLVEMGLITGGTVKSKGLKAALTNPALMLVEYFGDC